MSNMEPIPVPLQAVRMNPRLRSIHVGPPPGISDEDCGTPEVLAGQSDDGYPVFADYWRPTPEQLNALIAGGYIELRQYHPQMIMHSMTVYGPEDGS